MAAPGGAGRGAAHAVQSGSGRRRRRAGTQRSAQDKSDAALVEAIAAGDKHALQVLYGRHHVKVYRFALRFVRDECRRRRHGERGFHRRVASGRAVRAPLVRSRPGCWRSPATRRCPRCAAARTSSWTRKSPNSSRIRRTTRRSRCRSRSAAQILRSCLEQLSPAHREIIDLVYYHERTIEEVSEIIGVPANTVKTRMFYARKRIGEMMAARGIERYAI